MALQRASMISATTCCSTRVEEIEQPEIGVATMERFHRLDRTPVSELDSARPSQIPRIVDIASRTSATPKNPYLNKQFPITPAMTPVGTLAVTPLRVSSLPRAVPRTGENAFKPREFDGDSALALPDEQRRSTKYGLGGPTVRFANDIDEWVMGPDGKEELKSKDTAGKGKGKTEFEIASSFRTNRTSDATLASRFALDTVASKRRASASTSADINNMDTGKGKAKDTTPTPSSLKSRMSALLNRRSLTAGLTTPTPGRQRVSTPISVTGRNGFQAPSIPVPARRRGTTIPRQAVRALAPPVAAPVQAEASTQTQALTRVQTEAESELKYKEGLGHLHATITRYRTAIASRPHDVHTTRLITRLAVLVEAAVQLNEARAARMHMLKHLEALAGEEVLCVAGSVQDVQDMIDELQK